MALTIFREGKPPLRSWELKQGTTRVVVCAADHAAALERAKMLFKMDRPESCRLVDR